MRRLAAPFAVILVIVLASSVVAAVTWRSATTSRSAENVLEGLVAREHLRVCGTELSIDARLVWIARYRATDMAVNGYYAHVNPWTHRRVFALYERVGIWFRTAGEILARNSYPADLAAKGAFASFMGSRSHRAAIRACTYSRFGVGTYGAGDKQWFVVEFIQT